MSRAILFLLSACLIIVYYSKAEEISISDNEDNISREQTNEREGNVTNRISTFAHASSSAIAQRPQSDYVLIACYSCNDCPKVDDSTPVKLCPSTSDPLRNGRCVEYAEKYRHMDRPWYVRGCASELGSCDEIRKAHSLYPHIVSLLYCDDCETNVCNDSHNGASSITDCAIAVISMIIVPILSKYTLS